MVVLAMFVGHFRHLVGKSQVCQTSSKQGRVPCNEDSLHTSILLTCLTRHSTTEYMLGHVVAFQDRKYVLFVISSLTQPMSYARNYFYITLITKTSSSLIHFLHLTVCNLPWHSYRTLSKALPFFSYHLHISQVIIT